MAFVEPSEYLEFLEAYPEATQELARQARQKVLSMIGPCYEIIYDATNTVGSGFGYGPKRSHHFIHLPAYTKYVNLGFNAGSELNDPEKRLQGTGAKIRHIRINQAEDLDDRYIIDLIEQAVALAPRSPDFEPGIEIYLMQGAKRRPNK